MARRASASAGAVLVTALVLFVMCAVELFGLRSGTVGVILVGALAALAVAAIIFRVSFAWAGVGAACAAAFTLTWNGWYVGPVRPGDALVLVSLMCFLLANPNGAFRTPPWWVKQLAIVLLLLVAVHIFFPPDPLYLSQRIVLDALGQPTVSTKGSLAGANLGVAFKFIVAVAAVPIAFTAAVRVDRRAVRWLAFSFAAGSGLSGGVALFDHFGTDLGRIITGIPNIGDRQLGFSDHPNFLAAGMCIATPFAFWLVLSARRFDRIVGTLALIGTVGGTYATGSRGGAVCVVLALAVCVVLNERTRVHTPMFAMGGAFAVGVIAVFVPSVGATILRVTRLAGGPATSGSDTVRALVGAQGVRDFKHSPISGVGLQVSFEASEVYLQELASGGLILFAAMSIYMLGAMLTAYRTMPGNPLAASVLAALVVTLALNLFEADLTDRFYYVPAAILIALIHARTTDPPDDEQAPAADAEAVSRKQLVVA